MDFEDTPEEAAYRVQVREWLEANAPEDRGDPAVWHAQNVATLGASRAWQRKKADAGYARITWPKEWGGAGGTAVQNIIFAQEEARAGLGLSGPFGIGLQLCLPTIMTVGDEATKQRFAGPALRGEEIWCQLFSEPGSGSDLAGARTRAERDGDEWVVNGSKIWTSGAHYSDFGMLLARTNPDVPKHKGLTMFWVDMKALGVEVKPVHQISGGSGFNQVFFTDVRLKDSQRIGEEGGGWKAALVTLMHERAAAGGGTRETTTRGLMRLARQLETLTGASALEDSALREKLADWYIQAEGVRLTGLRSLTALSRGQTPGPEASVAKAVMASRGQNLAYEGIELQDQFGIVSDPTLVPAGAQFQASVLSTPGLRIAGGTDEILHNIIAERVLGLPPEIRVDKDVPARDLK